MAVSARFVKPEWARMDPRVSPNPSAGYESNTVNEASNEFA
jgi:hypothetical protein